MGDVSADQSPFKDEGARLKALADLTRKATIGAQPLSLDEQQRAGIILGTQFPNVQKVEKDDAGNIRIVRYDEKVAPSVYGPLIAQLNAGARRSSYRAGTSAARAKCAAASTGALA